MDLDRTKQEIINFFNIDKEQLEKFIQNYLSKDRLERPSINYSYIQNHLDFTIPQVSREDVKIAFYHLTTNNNKCNEILELGIRDLQFVCTKNTQFSRFLKKNKISINLNDAVIEHGKHSIKYIPDVKYYSAMISPPPEAHLVHKLYFDNIPWGFKEFDKLENYSCIHKYPEFLKNLSMILERTDLLVQWENEENKTYLVKALVPVQNLDEASIGILKEDVGKSILEIIIPKLLTTGQSSSESYLWMKQGRFIKSSEIIKIQELNIEG